MTTITIWLLVSVSYHSNNSGNLTVVERFPGSLPSWSMVQVRLGGSGVKQKARRAWRRRVVRPMEKLTAAYANDK